MIEEPWAQSHLTATLKRDNKKPKRSSWLLCLPILPVFPAIKVKFATVGANRAWKRVLVRPK